MRLTPLLLSALLLVSAARAQGDPTPAVTPTRGVDWRARTPHTGEWRVRLEAASELTALLPGAKTKQGPAAFAHTIHLRKDARLGAGPAVGWRALAELQTPIRLAFTASYAREQLEGERRAIHYRGLTLGTTFHPGGTPVRSALELQRAGAQVRFVIFDDSRLHLSVGAGAAWAALRLGTSARALGHESRRVETVWVPTIGYRVSWRPFEFLSLFLESSVGVLAPTRPSALWSETRLGAVWHLLDERIGLITAVSSFSADMEGASDRWGGKPTAGHRYEQASLSLLGGELGLQLRF